MAVKMRLRREGKRKQPFYRVVVADARSPRDGRFIEDIGYYHPLREPSEIEIKRERALYWLGEGVQPSDAVRQLLRVTGIWEEFRPGDVGRQRPSQQASAAAAKAAGSGSAAPEEPGVTAAEEPGVTAAEEPGVTAAEEPGVTAAEEPTETADAAGSGESDADDAEEPAEAAAEDTGATTS
jgi:small subunit ribosomal protein S16